jgi:hypothetical protein
MCAITLRSHWAHLMAIGVPGAAFLGFTVCSVLSSVDYVPPGRDGNNCVSDVRPDRSTLILLDGTDPFSPSQIIAARRVINQVIDSAGPNEMITIALIGEIPPRTVVSLCSEPRGEAPTFGDLFSNPGQNWHQQRAQWQIDFDRPLRETEAELRFDRVAPYSPIMATICMTASRFRSGWASARQQRLIVFSDLMEHMRDYSHYGRAPNLDFRTVRLTVPYLRGLSPALKGATVELYQLEAKHGYPVQFNAHRAFWRDFFLFHGASVTRFDALPFN